MNNNVICIASLTTWKLEKILSEKYYKIVILKYTSCSCGQKMFPKFCLYIFREFIFCFI